MPRVDAEVLLASRDVELARWLTSHGIRNRPYVPGEPQKAREVILASGKPAADPGTMFPDLARRIARGSTVDLPDDGYVRPRQPNRRAGCR